MDPRIIEQVEIWTQGFKHMDSDLQIQINTDPFGCASAIHNSLWGFSWVWITMDGPKPMHIGLDLGSIKADGMYQSQTCRLNYKMGWAGAYYA